MFPLIDAQSLERRLADLVIVDCRHDLAQPQAGLDAYRAGHIPGAVFAHLDQTLSGACNGANGRHPLPEPEALAAWLGTNGIGNDTDVVAYDASGGVFAARLWWLLRWLGHRRVQVLDGGLAAWQGCGFPLSTAVVHKPALRFVPQSQPQLRVNVADVLANLTEPRFVLIDARSPERFAGLGETLDPVAGHIPGALNAFYQNNLAADGRFKTPAALREQWQALLQGQGADAAVHQCGSGVTACHNLLALEAAGLSGGRLYPGSWSEWCADETRPMVRR
ncbi:sulfurtransferase [Chitiniphilus purpureus]|uniref:Sulfurtransferase n=1 Tax=Chitiniphilus purpureus TaxID=2981137 RepID=A0ABY6DMU0_9NEIS|nr:sulfurtransferase [Chitiniphilus sp. CD1]UXY14421.1 sulfurtransferase [Chitiniphilus sp. CD1]